MLQGRLRENGWLGRFAVAISLAFVSGTLIGYLSRSNPPDIISEYFSAIPSMSSCIADILKSPSSQAVSLPLMGQATDLCYERIRSQGLLNDFLLIRLGFIQQNYADNVVLWMVVILTMSGVLLAALQLGASYKLTSTGKRNGVSDYHEITVEQGKIVLKSSIAGVVILLISFAFFYVFIIYVYKLEPINLEDQKSRADVTRQTVGVESGQEFGVGHELDGGALGGNLNGGRSLSSKAAPASTTP